MARAQSKITKRVVDSAAPEASRYTIWDRDIAGFGLRVEPSGSKSYVFFYRPKGAGRAAASRSFVRIGRAAPEAEMTPQEAREQAEAFRVAVRSGQDPSKRRPEGVTFDDIADRFLAEHVEAVRKPATAKAYRRILNNVREKFGTRPAAEVSRAEILGLHRAMKDTPVLANRMLAVVGSLYSWAAEAELIASSVNPVSRVKAKQKFTETKRQRYLSVAELDRLGAALRTAETIGLPWTVDEEGPKAKHLAKAANRRVTLEPGAIAAIRLLLFTGARLREILHLQWQHVDLERGLLILPDSKTGQKSIVLSGPAVAVLSKLKRISAFVFPGSSIKRPRADLKRPWKALAKEAGLEGVRLHDLRHTYASVGVGANLGLPVVGRLLGHTQASTTARYAHLADDPLRAAAERIGGAIAASMGDRPGEAQEPEKAGA